MTRGLAAVLAALLSLSACAAEAPPPFDYYVLSLSWSPEYCASEARPKDPQCVRPYAFVVHGLWPQYERGWPKDCGRGEYLSNELIANAMQFMPSKPLVIHEWRKHGVCSGLSAARYFDTAERAYRSITIPARFTALEQPLSTTVQQIEAAFLAANPKLSPDMIATQCRGRHLQELRLCMTPDLQPRRCGVDLKDRCGREVVLRPSRG
jgi:ribonuclease T2